MICIFYVMLYGCIFLQVNFLLSDISVLLACKLHHAAKVAEFK